MNLERALRLIAGAFVMLSVLLAVYVILGLAFYHLPG